MFSRNEKDKLKHKPKSHNRDNETKCIKSKFKEKKKPLRIQNDWSEHISSRGIIYYYNIRTSLSQWRQPIDWTLPSIQTKDSSRSPNIVTKNCLNVDVKRNSHHKSQLSKKSSKTIINHSKMTLDERLVCNDDIYGGLFKDNLKGNTFIKSCLDGADCISKDVNMDISPSRSPMNRHSAHIDELEGQSVINEEHNRLLTHISDPHTTLYTLLKSAQTLLQLRSSSSSTCISVALISDLVVEFETVLHTYASVKCIDNCHRTKTLLSDNTPNNRQVGTKHGSNLQTTVDQIKELIKYLQNAIQNNNSRLGPTDVLTPNNSNILLNQHNLKMFHQLIEKCLLHVPASPACVIPEPRPSILLDPELVRFVRRSPPPLHPESQPPHLKIDRLQSVIYPELRCRSKQLIAVARAGAIRAEMLEHRKAHLGTLVAMIGHKGIPGPLQQHPVPHC